MEVKIGQFIITSTGDEDTPARSHRGFVLKKVAKVRKSKKTKPENIGKEKEIDLGYHVTFEQAMQNLVNHKLRESDAKTLDEVKVLIWELKAEIKKDYSLEKEE